MDDNVKSKKKRITKNRGNNNSIVGVLFIPRVLILKNWYKQVIVVVETTFSHSYLLYKLDWSVAQPYKNYNEISSTKYTIKYIFLVGESKVL